MNTPLHSHSRRTPPRVFAAWRWSLALVMALLAAAISHDARAASEAAERIERIARDTVIRALTQPGHTVSARPRVDSRLALAACGSPPEARLPPRITGTTVTVRLQCPGPGGWTLYVPVETTRHGPVAVLARALRRGEAVDAGALRIEQRDLNALPYGHFSGAAPAVGQVARRDLAAGVAVSPRDLVPATVIRRGQAVTLVGRLGGIEVRARGTALAAGSLNQRIRVRNQHSRRVIEGLVRSATEVQVPM